MRLFKYLLRFLQSEIEIFIVMNFEYLFSTTIYCITIQYIICNDNELDKYYMTSEVLV